MHRFIIFCYDNESTRILIEAMHNSWAFYPIYNRWSFICTRSECFKMIQKCVYECPLSSFFTWSWMSIDSCIFVDNGKVIIFKDNIKRDIFCDEFHILYCPMNFYGISSIDFLIFCEILPITVYFSIFYHLLYIASGFFGKKSRQICVDSSGFSRICENTEFGECIGVR